MSRRDWNHNGKRDMFDRGVDFQLAKYWYEKNKKNTSEDTCEFTDDYGIYEDDDDEDTW